MTIEFLTEIPDDVREEFRKSNICPDDWDYALVCPEDAFETDEDGELVPKSWYLERPLTGCCDNTWTRTTYKGKDVVVGMAYHA